MAMFLLIFAPKEKNLGFFAKHLLQANSSFWLISQKKKWKLFPFLKKKRQKKQRNIQKNTAQDPKKLKNKYFFTENRIFL